MSADRFSPRELTFLIMGAVLLWGTILAIGAALFGIDQQSGRVTLAPNPVRGAIVLGCVLAFLGFWVLALRSRRSKRNRASGIENEATQTR